MKRLLRFILASLFLLFSFPFFLYKKYGNGKTKLRPNSIIICNHYSDFDGFFISLAFGLKKINFVTIAQVKKKILPRFLAWLFDCLYLDYDTANFEFFKTCIKILKSGGTVCIFPEGVVNPAKYGFFDFRKSFVYLARKTDAQILPLYLYPELKPFKKSKLYLGEYVKTNEYAHIPDLYGAATFFQCKIIEYAADCK